MLHLGDIEANIFSEVMIFIEDIGEKVEEVVDMIITSTNNK